MHSLHTDILQAMMTSNAVSHRDREIIESILPMYLALEEEGKQHFMNLIFDTAAAAIKIDIGKKVNNNKNSINYNNDNNNVFDEDSVSTCTTVFKERNSHSGEQDRVIPYHQPFQARQDVDDAMAEVEMAIGAPLPGEELLLQEVEALLDALQHERRVRRAYDLLDDVRLVSLTRVCCAGHRHRHALGL